MFELRRIVTATDEAGRSVVGIDDAGSNDLRSETFPGLVMHDLWATSETPAVLTNGSDRAQRAIRIEPDPGGSVFRIIELPPDDPSATVDRRASASEFGLPGPSEEAISVRHHTMHRTDTLDYLVVLSGEMWMLLDDSEVLLTPGSCVVQQATVHGFSNRSDNYCVFAAVLLDAGVTLAPEDARPGS